MPAQSPPGQGNAGWTLTTAHWPDVEAGARRLLVVPVGSLEQHGAHLPLDTDTRIAVAVAGRACAGRAGGGLAAPLAIGAGGRGARAADRDRGERRARGLPRHAVDRPCRLVDFAGRAGPPRVPPLAG